jgi:hypothetical protein
MLLECLAAPPQDRLLTHGFGPWQADTAQKPSLDDRLQKSLHALPPIYL